MSARALVALAAVCVAGPAFSFADLRSEYSAQNSIVRATSYGAGSTSSGTVIRGTGTIAGPGGPVTVAVESQLTRGMILRGAARLIPYAGAALVLKDIYDAYRVQPQADGTILYDEGEAKRSFLDYWCTDTSVDNVRRYGSGPGAACSAWIAAAGSSFGPWQGCTIAGSYRVRTTLSLGAFRAPNGYDIIVERTPMAGEVCEGSMEPGGTTTLENALVTGTESRMRCEHGGASPVDGKCKRGAGGTYDGTMTGPQFQDKGDLPPLDYPGLDPALPGILADAVGRATDAVPIPAPDALTRVVEPLPAEVPGATTTTNNADGTVTETATGWNIRPAFDFKSPSVNPWAKKTTTTQKDSAGNVTSTSTSSTEPSPAGDGTDPCKADPGRLGCIGLGTVDDVEVPAADKTITFTPDPGWGSVGECPTPPTITFLGKSIVVSNDGFCTGLLMLRGIVLVFASLVAARIVSEGLK